MVFIKSILVVSLLWQAIHALPAGEQEQGMNLDGYTPDVRVGSLIEKMQTQSDGFFSVGADGVLRSFAGSGSVLDYHQLDPSQVARFARAQLAAWESSAEEVPDSVSELANAGEIDGRLVLDEQLLLEPSDRPSPGPKPLVSKAERAVDLEDRVIQKRCVGSICQSLGDCTAIGCAACFYPMGPPNGVCFLT